MLPPGGCRGRSGGICHNRRKFVWRSSEETATFRVVLLLFFVRHLSFFLPHIWLEGTSARLIPGTPSMAGRGQRRWRGDTKHQEPRFSPCLEEEEEEDGVGCG